MVQRKQAIPGDSLYLDPELVRQLDARLARIEGHVRGIRKMLAEQRDCDDILTQVAGVKAGINQAGIVLLEGHLDSCVSKCIVGGDGAEPLERFKTSLQRVLR